ncbi:replicative DNA helicase (plasmid) [Vibrio scophthalmi]|uniref:replicative DNA helicase n=1 Tax=Vibrio scophthalmi TaxID=45658 RepID=UPI003EC1564F
MFNVCLPIINLIFSTEDAIDQVLGACIDTSQLSDDATFVCLETAFELHTSNQTVDFNTVTNHVYTKYGDVGANAVSELINQALSQPADINALDDYLQQILNLQGLRLLQKRIQSLMAQSTTEQSPDVLLSEMSNIVESYDASSSQKDNEPKTLQDAMLQAVDQIEDVVKGNVKLFHSGFEGFDKGLGHFRAADFVIIAGRPSHGKTTSLLNIIRNSSHNNDEPFLFFSLEMPCESISENLLSCLSRVELNKIRNGEMNDIEWSKAGKALQDSKEYNLHIDDDPMSIEELCRRARRFYRKHKGKLSGIGVDYIQLLHSERIKSDNRNLEVSEISRCLKALAKELGVPVFALSQLSRKVEERGDKRPMNSDLRESGSLEQDADVIIFVYRDHMYNKESPANEAEFIIGKARKSAIGSHKVLFEGQYASVKDAGGYTGAPYSSRSPSSSKQLSQTHTQKAPEPNSDASSDNNDANPPLQFIN